MVVDRVVVDRVVAPLGQVDDLDDATGKAAGLLDSLVDAVPRLGVAAATLIIGWLASRLLRWVLHARWKRTRTHSFAVVMPELAGWGLLTVVVTAATAIEALRRTDIMHATPEAGSERAPDDELNDGVDPAAARTADRW